MTAVLRLVRHYIARKPHTPRHAKPVEAPTPDHNASLERSA